MAGGQNMQGMLLQLVMGRIQNQPGGLGGLAKSFLR